MRWIVNSVGAIVAAADPCVGRSGTELCSTLVGVALQILAGGLTVTGAHAAEAAEALYPGRYIATCKPRARFWLCLRDRFSRTGAVQRIQR
jgi:hypothetical protein